MRLGTAIAAAALCAATPLAAAQPAAAADMPSYYSAPAAGPAVDGPQEFGTGWYLRGDAAFSAEDRPRLLLRDGAPAFRDGSANGYAFGAGAGYQFTDWFRADVTADYLDPFHYAVTTSCGTGCTLDRRTEIQRFDGLVNGYVDLGSYAGFTPYFGAGVGVAGTRQDGSLRAEGSASTSGVPTRTGYGFAWAAMAGVSYAVAPHTLLDIGYRYLDLGRTTVSLAPAAVVTRGLSAQQVRVGLRYMID